MADRSADVAEEDGPMATEAIRRRRAIERLVATDHARDRLARAAFDILADGLDLGPFAVRSAADREWVRAALARPIRRTADHAIDRLIVELFDVLADGCPELVARMLAAAGDDMLSPTGGSATFEAVLR